MPDTIMQNPPQAGSTAPDFSAKSTSGETFTLSSLRGKKNALIAFFPLAFTGTCTKEMRAFTDDYDLFAEKDVEVVPISVDSVDSLLEFKSKLGMRTDLVSDFKREISRAYGVLIEERFYSNRAYFLVDKQGIVRWAFVEAHPGQRRENSEILAQIEALSKGG